MRYCSGLSSVFGAAFLVAAAEVSLPPVRVWFGPRFHQTLEGPSTSTRPPPEAKPVAGERRGVPGTRTNGGCYAIDMCCCCCCCGVVIHSPALDWRTRVGLSDQYTRYKTAQSSQSYTKTHTGEKRVACCYTNHISNKNPVWPVGSNWERKADVKWRSKSKMSL